MLHSLLNTEELKYNHYIRILGINHQGIAYLNTLPKNCKTFIFASPKEIENKNLFDLSPLKDYNPFNTCASAQMLIRKD